MISISIVSLNSPIDANECIDSLLKNVIIKDVQILVNAFNYSQDSALRLQARYAQHPSVTISFTSGVRGYSSNHNINLAKAKHDIVCILNDDVYVESDIFSSMYEIMRSPDVAACCPVLLNYDGSVQLLYRKKATPWSTLAMKTGILRFAGISSIFVQASDYNLLKKRQSIDIPFGTGACFCIKRQCLPGGMLDDRFFLTPDDLLWSHQLRGGKGPNRIVLSTGDVLYHRGHSSISKFFPAALPAQIKGMIEFYELLGFKSMFLFKLCYYILIIMLWIHNGSLSVLRKSEHHELLRRGYANAIRVYWKRANNTAVFRFFQLEESKRSDNLI